MFTLEVRMLDYITLQTQYLLRPLKDKESGRIRKARLFVSP